MFRIPTLRLATLAAAAWLLLTPARAEAQKALVYCPVGIDAAGCNTIVAALTSSALFPEGVDAGYDGTSGTVDLAGGDLSGYGVFVVPSLADGPDVQPYSLLRNGTIAGRIQAAVHGAGGGVVGYAGRGVDQPDGQGRADPEPGGMGEGGRGGNARAGRGGAAGQLG